MPLESLHKLVEKLRKRIDAYADVLKSNEALTRYAVIDPLLRELGWDTEDPDQVRPEYPLRTEYNPGTKSADYALLSNGRAAMIVEAKKLGTPLRDSVLSQGINYCQVEGTKYFAVTDGRHWEIYATHEPVPIDEKRIIAFDLCGPNTAEVCLSALALWRPSVQSGNASPGQPPVIETVDGEPDPPPQTHPPIDQHDWQDLSSVTTRPGQEPVEVLFPDNSRTPVSNWAAMPTEVVRWLMDRRMLSASDCPIMSERSSVRYMVSTDPVHSNGAPFTVPRKVGGLYVEAHDNRPSLVRKTKFIIQHAGQDPARFKIRLS